MSTNIESSQVKPKKEITKKEVSKLLGKLSDTVELNLKSLERYDKLINSNIMFIEKGIFNENTVNHLKKLTNDMIVSVKQRREKYDSVKRKIKDLSDELNKGVLPVLDTLLKAYSLEKELVLALK